ncbi:MAG: hypothetical protein JWL77_5157 [Chthonomonadaceae bacterium]|nr:hypothetical protein [Chthonomonadaceae bacterium]
MRIQSLITAAILSGSLLGGSISTFAFQRNGGQDRGGAGQSQPPRSGPQGSGQQPRQTGSGPVGGGQKSGPTGTPPGRAQQIIQPTPPPVHAQREVVRTPNFVPRTTGGTAPLQPPVRTPTPGVRTNNPPGQPPVRTPNPGARNNNLPNQPPVRTPTPGVRTNNPPFQPSVRNQNPGGRDNRFPNQTTVRRPVVPNAPEIQVQRRFTKTSEGRVYDNGLRLRKGIPVTAAWQKRYFPKGHYHFPYYRNTFVRGQTFLSPFGFYYGASVPYISASEGRIYPPAVDFIDVPVYSGGRYTGFEDANDQNLFDDPNLDQEEPGLRNAIDCLTEAFQGGNIDCLVTLVDPNTSIAIYQNGHYQYSLPANDYIDLARDAVQSMHTVDFRLNDLHQRAPNVFSVAGRQTYQDQNGQTRTTWVSFVLQDIGGHWTLTQVGTAPERIQNP